MYTKEYHIKSYEVSCNNALKEHVLLNYFQDIASEHADVLGFGTKFINENGLTWFLLKYNIKFLAPVSNISAVVINTWSRGIERLWCNRDFEVFDLNNNLLAVAASSWVVIDLKNRKPVRPDKYLKDFPFESRNVLEMFAEKHSVEGIEPVLTKTFVPSYDDIDVNLHVNNSVYFLWAEDTLPFDFRKSHNISGMEICYKKEVTPNDTVVSEVFTRDDFASTLHTVSLRETNELCFSLKIFWKKI